MLAALNDERVAVARALDDAAESVRLVIWDLDETFWNGTLTEGGITQVAENIQIVKTLAERGIISSICSKNDLEPVQKILEAEGIWDYFILPSIDWSPKGLRIQQLIEDVQLRPGTVLFIDDNPINLNEAKHLVPELQIASHEIIPHLLGDPKLKGKEDSELSRLNQYKLLERRKRDSTEAGPDQAAFLRSSNIRVEILHDFEPHIGRAVELINRTNQLNFTKVRLSDDTEQAKNQLRGLVSDAQVQAGLIHVRDNYGDHGLCGIYVKQQGRLVHFAFSCRILGMGVETWLYERLGSPEIRIVGDVLTNIREHKDIDWINQAGSSDDATATEEFPFLIARGGCDLDAIAHYLQFITPRIVGEFNISREGFDARRDHSIFTRYALDGITPEQLAVANRLGYRAEDFSSALVNDAPGGAYLLSFLADTAYALYRHRDTGLRIPFAVSGRSNHREDARTAQIEQLPAHYRTGTHWFAEALRILQYEFDYEGPISMEELAGTLRDLLDRLPEDSHVFIIGGNETLRDRTHGHTHVSHATRELNQTLRAVIADRPKTHILPFRDFIESEDEVQSWSHFERMVYFRMAERLRELTKND